MKDFFCKNCSFLLTGKEDFCPQCNIPVKEINNLTDEFYVCPVCEAKNPTGEKKCQYCCSIL